MKRFCILGVAGGLLVSMAGAQTVVEGKVTLPPRTAPEVINKRYEISGRQAVILPDPPAAVVYLEGKFSGTHSVPRATLLQEGFDFIPRLLPVEVGTVVDFPNHDRTYHSIFSFSKPKRFDLGRYRGDEVPVPSVRFDQPGPVVLRCDIHEHMRAIILVLETPHFVRTDGEGRYRLGGLPPGSYVLKAWLSDRQILEKPVQLRRGNFFMSIFPEGRRVASGRLAVPHQFRGRLTLVLATLVTLGTILVLVVTQRVEEEASARALRDRFQARLGFILGAQRAREAFVTEQCKLLARSVRIQAALEARDWENLYAVARIELRGVLADGTQPVPRRGVAPQAEYFRIVSADNAALPDPGSAAGLQPWENRLATMIAGTARQEIGFVAVAHDGDIRLLQMVATPILGSEGERLATLVLGFPHVEEGLEPDADLRSGLWVEDTLHASGLAPADRKELASQITRRIGRSEAGEEYPTVELRGGRWLLFHQVLNPGGTFPPARLVCLYSLAGAEAAQHRVRSGILIAGVLVMLTGLGASHAFSSTLSRPVEALDEERRRQSVRRREAEAERDRSELKYRAIFENAVEGIFVLTPEGQGVDFNPAMARLLGYDSPVALLDATSVGWEVFFASAPQARGLLETVKTQGLVRGFECALTTRPGARIWVSINARAVCDPEGRLLRLEGTLEDVSERRTAAENLQRVNEELQNALSGLKAAQQQLVQSERLNALGQMASGIAHDFNNSLVPITGYSELLLANPDLLRDPRQTAHYLEIIRTAARDGASIVARLREFYRTSQPTEDFAPVSLVPLIRQSILLTQPKWKRQAQAGGIEIKISEELAPVPLIMGNDSALRELFTNLIFNAVDAMPSGGCMTFRTRTEGGAVVVEVADSGTGMTEEVRRRCLEPFFTTKGERGTGLGLSMVFGIVQRHGGKMDLQSRLGHGTCFILRFPPRVVEPAAAGGAGVAELKPGALRVLLAEDDRQVREVLTAFLQLDGHRVCGAPGGDEALDFFGEETFDVVITDMAMPGLSGPQLAQEIKRRAPQIPVILLSGFNSPDQSGPIPDVDVMAAKPITMTALRKALRQAVERSPASC